MDANSWRAAQPLAQPQGGEAAGIAASGAAPASGSMETGDWRAQLPHDSRQRIVSKIMDTLKKHLPFSGQEGLQELKKIAVRFEEKIYAAAINQADYLRKISLKMLSMETKSSNPLANPPQANAANISQTPQGTGSHAMQLQVNNQAQPLSVPMVSNQSQARQQLLSQNIQNTITSAGMQNSVNLVSALPSAGNSTQINIPNAASQNSNLQNVQGIPIATQNSVGNTLGHSNMIVNSIRQIQERQQQVVSQQQQQQSQTPNTHIYQQQLHRPVLKPKFQSQVQHPQEQQQQPNIQQQVQSFQQQTQSQSSQQVALQPSTAHSTLSNLQQNQQSSIQQQSQSMIQQLSQSVLRQHQQQGSVLQSQQQQPQQQQQNLIGQQQNIVNIQKNQPIGQQNMSDMQHQQTRLTTQQNSYSSVQQQQLVNQQINVPSIHQQQIGTQGNVAGLSHQKLAGDQSSNSGLTTNQHAIQMSQQSKVQVQQQMLPSATLLPAQGLQSQSQQQMMPQNQSQPGPLQPPFGLQQQQPNTLQREMQHRLQNPNPILQQQNLSDQQKQIFQPQRATPDASSTSLDSTAQTGNTNFGDWQEEAYQKIKSMKDMYFMDLSELYHKIAGKLAQHDSLPQHPKNDQIEKLKMFKVMVERLLHMLRFNKNDIQPQHKEKLSYIERQIIYFLNSNRTRKPQPPQAFDGQINLQAQSVNLQGTMATMQHNSLNNMQHNPMSSLSAVPNSQQSMISTIQPGASIDMGHGSSLGPLQQVSSGALQQTQINGPQQMNISSFSSQGGQNSLQSNLQQNSNMLQHPKQHEQQMLQNQQLRQQFQQRQIQQQILQQQQQFKQGQAPSAAHSMSQLHQLVDTNDIRTRQHIGSIKSGGFQQHQPLGPPRVALHHPQLKPSISSPQVHQTSSPQLAQHLSPQFDQQNALVSHTKTGTPLQSASSPFVQSPSTPLAPSPMPGDSEKVSLGAPSLLGPGNVGIQQTSASAQSLAIDTPGISTSPLLPEIYSLDGTHTNVSTSISGKSTIEQPLERLVNAVRKVSAKALNSSVSDISSVISMMDRIAGSAPGNGSRAAVGEDLVAMTKCRLQARNFFPQDGPTGTKRMKCYTASNVVSSSGNLNDGFALWNCSEVSDLESTATSSINKLKINHALIEEIRAINQQLIDTVVEISDEAINPSVLTAATAATDGSEGTIVRCSFMAVALSPNLKSQCSLAQMSPIQSLRLLVPANYPNCSPIFMDSFPVEVSKEYECVSDKIRSRLFTSLRSLSQPVSLGDIARTWDFCTRAVISEYAQQSGGGSFSSKYGTWEDTMATAA
ncbi:unnamed protein product [Cuscuta campestris]|uniref:Mediator complex subunit 15 KIX domain-containing protein n=1 Tax=Cuscuta campestris TaxID=132261 RepID=A0A484NNJ7_9ASTE|nr:unnamed protein product [Cuscuta campestris]